MFSLIRLIKCVLILVVAFSLGFSLFFTGVSAQKKSQKKKGKDKPHGTSKMWESVDIGQRDLYLGPGGSEMQPDLSNITFIKAETAGASKKFRIKDGTGNTWVAKVGYEAKPETAAVRLLWGIGYKTEINYLVPSLTIPGQGTFTNVRLEARPKNIDRLGNWAWKKNTFSNTKEFQGLKMMMVFFNNWDLKGESQNVILQNKDIDENYYVVSDLGATFGKLGNNSLPIFWRFGRSVGNPGDYANSRFVKGAKHFKLKMAFKGKTSGIFHDITVEQGRWLADLLLQLDDKQISDAFRAANYSPADIKTYTQAVKKRIADLDRATK